MDVVSVVAADTTARSFDLLFGRLGMTGLTAQTLMFAIEGEVSLFVVIKAPESPIVRGMAVGTICTERGFMSVVILVATDAFQCSIFIRLPWMARFTAGDRMLSDERETTQVVVEADVGTERFFVVALFTTVTQLPCMDIFAAVAADAGGVEFLR